MNEKEEKGVKELMEAVQLETCNQFNILKENCECKTATQFIQLSIAAKAIENLEELYGKDKGELRNFIKEKFGEEEVNRIFAQTLKGLMCFMVDKFL